MSGGGGADSGERALYDSWIPVTGAGTGWIGSMLHHGGDEVPETPIQIEQANIAQQQWQDYQKRWLPLQQYYINRTEGGLGGKMEEGQGVANTDVQGQFGNAENTVQNNLSKRQLGLGSGAAIGADTDLAGSKGAALGLGKTGAADAVTRQYEGALSDIVAMGRGQRASSDQSLADISQISGESAAQNAQIAAQNASGTGELIGTGVGTGGGYLMRALNQPSQPSTTQTPSPSYQPIQAPSFSWDQLGLNGANFDWGAPSATPGQ